MAIFFYQIPLQWKKFIYPKIIYHATLISGRYQTWNLKKKFKKKFITNHGNKLYKL
jgi:hypothetical protein